MSDYTALYETLQQEDTISEADLSKLRALSDLSYSSLPNYEQRKRDSQLKELENRVPKLQKTKARFGAKKAVKAEEPVLPSAVVPKQEWTEKAVLKSNAASSINLSRLRSCLVNYLDQRTASVAHLSDLHDCVVVLPRVTGSIFLEKCTNCLLVCACQQLRMHTSTDTDVWLHVETDPIIEKCQRIRFCDSPLEQHQSSTPSHHASVQDFDRPAHSSTGEEKNWFADQSISDLGTFFLQGLLSDQAALLSDEQLVHSSRNLLPKALQ